jgi:RNA polymerase sigma-70 factor (ECF subfamily)
MEIDRNVLGESEFSRLVALTQVRIRKCCWRLTQNPESAEELNQEVLLDAWRQRENFNMAEPHGFAGWLESIAKGVRASQVRRDIRRHDKLAASLSAGTIPWMDSRRDAPSTDQLYSEFAAAERTLERISQLEPHLARVLHLRATRDMTISEIASKLGIPVSTAGRHLKEARRQFAASIQPEASG